MLYCSLVIYLKNRNLEASNDCYLFECWVISFVLSSIIHQVFAYINVVKHTSSSDTRIKHANFKILITLKIVNSRRVMGSVSPKCVENTSDSTLLFGLRGDNVDGIQQILLNPCDVFRDTSEASTSFANGFGAVSYFGFIEAGDSDLDSSGGHEGTSIISLYYNNESTNENKVSQSRSESLIPNKQLSWK